MSQSAASLSQIVPLLIKLGRYDRPAGAWLLALPCLWGVAAAAPTWQSAFSAAFSMIVGAFVMRGAGCTYNDWVDRDIDQEVLRTRNRPLAAGQLTTWQAWMWIALQMLVGLGVLICMPYHVRGLAASAVLWVALYPWTKRFFLAPQLVLGITFNWGLLVGWAVFQPLSSWIPWALYAAGILWTLGYDTIYAFQDITDDKRLGVRSTAILFEHYARPALIAIYGCMLVLLSIVVMYMPRHKSWTTALLAILGILALQVFLRLQKLKFDQPSECLLAFRANIPLGWLIVALLAMRLLH